MRGQLGAALMLLTRLPGACLIGPGKFPAGGSCLWAYPLVGALVGGLGAAVLGFLPPGLGAVWALVAMAVVTGGLHEDGLADMADGFGGGRSVARKLEIMRDSRVGSYGVLAVVLAVSVRWSALADTGGAALIAAGALSRAGMAVPMLTLRPARTDGLGAAVGAIPWASAAGCFGLAALVALMALPGRSALLAIGAALVAALAVARLAKSQIGGFTGDVLGGCAIIVEAVVLTALAST